jgi:Druantia protein DruA/DDE_Tnp_1-associated
MTVLNLREILVRPLRSFEEQRYQELMQQHHYLGCLPKISETLWYIALWGDQWVALLSFSASALKCAARDRWIGWNFRHQYDRLKLIVNNSRFLILPDWHLPNLGSRILSLCQRRLDSDWQKTFGHPVLLLETFVDPQRFHGTIYKAANWLYVGDTKGFRRTRHGYTATAQSPKMVFLKPLQSDARALLSQAHLPAPYRTGGSKMMLKAQQMQSLPSFFTEIPDPRRTQGRRHRLSTVLAIAAGACLCGMRGYKAIADWAESLGQGARQRFGCRYERGRYVVPSESRIRDVLIRVDPVHLDRALQRWNQTHGQEDESLAIDGKTMRNAIDDQGYQTHVLSAVGHQSKNCYTQKKWAPCP